MKLRYVIEGQIVFEPLEYRLWPVGKPDAAISLYVPVSQCFLLLLQHPDQVLSKESFFEEVWVKNGLFVNSNTFYQNMALLRKALFSLGVSKNIILTVPRQGVKFVGHVEYLTEEETTNFPSLEVQTEEAFLLNTDNAQEISPQKISFWASFSPKRSICYISAFVIILSLGWIIDSVYSLIDYESYFDESYHVVKTSSQCKIFSSSNDQNLNKNILTVYSALSELSCSAQDEAWITYNHKNSKVSVVKCNNSVSLPHTDCSVWLLPEINNE